jgi:hypothetical protein
LPTLKRQNTGHILIPPLSLLPSLPLSLPPSSPFPPILPPLPPLLRVRRAPPRPR